ncbi:PQQ-dependent sugar dehydrogenase, partial [Candidatus Daviesbacteria bacterium]|nr:PQQ-dependent sugar dehydrogenase [Candidatus Daviesbacteria bacterium]
MKKILILVLVAVAGIFWISFKNVSFKSAETVQTKQSQTEDIEIIAEDLQVPWEVVFLPAGTGNSDSEILVTERPGTLILLKNQQEIPVEGVTHIGEGGLLGFALHPDFINNRLIYLYLT